MAKWFLCSILLTWYEPKKWLFALRQFTSNPPVHASLPMGKIASPWECFRDKTKVTNFKVRPAVRLKLQLISRLQDQIPCKEGMKGHCGREEAPYHSYCSLPREKKQVSKQWLQLVMIQQLVSDSLASQPLAFGGSLTSTMHHHYE